MKSRRVLPPTPDSATRANVVGYFFLDAPMGYQPPAELARFIEAGPAPICVTFGSMLHRSSDRIADSVLDAIRIASQRAVMLTGSDGWKGRASTDNVLFLESAPHDWLFPKCKAVIHHGGAGTTAAGLRAGIPNIVIPFAGDQLFWGKRIYTIGAWPRPLTLKELTTKRLIFALAEIEGNACRSRAYFIGRAIRVEDGIGDAIRVVESCDTRKKSHAIF